MVALLRQNKEQEAKEELKRRVKQFDMQRREAQKHRQPFPTGSYGNSSYGGNTRPSSTYSEPTIQSATETARSYSRSVVVAVACWLARLRSSLDSEIRIISI